VRYGVRELQHRLGIATMSAWCWRDRVVRDVHDDLLDLRELVDAVDAPVSSVRARLAAKAGEWPA
jgi:hypothetical protein